MGFGGGGSAGMANHVHNNIPLQGGPLDFANDTIASLNAGSTTFSDGAALQELVIGNPSEVLRTNPAGTAPEWAAAGGASVATASAVMGGTFSSASATLVDIGLSVVKPNIAGGKCLTTVSLSCENQNQTSCTFAIEDNGVVVSRMDTNKSSAASDYCGNITLSDVGDADGNTIEIQGMGLVASNWVVRHSGTYVVPKVVCFAVG